MEQYIIKGGNPLVGEVVIGGAKNAALPVLAAAVMTDGKCMIDNMPDVRDINVLLQAMQEIGADVDRTGKHEVTISGKGIHPECDVDNEFIRKIRASYYLIGALLGKQELHFQVDVRSEAVRSTSISKDLRCWEPRLRLRMV